jgi:hypothetical protein
MISFASVEIQGGRVVMGYAVSYDFARSSPLKKGASTLSGLIFHLFIEARSGECPLFPFRLADGRMEETSWDMLIKRKKPAERIRGLLVIWVTLLGGNNQGRRRRDFFLVRQQFLPKNRHFPRRFDAEPNLAAIDIDHGDANVIVDYDFFAQLATENQHGASLL